MTRKLTIAWSLRDSLFHEYKRDNDAIISDCFEFDWSCLTKPKFREMANVDIIKSTLKKAYFCL